MLLATNILPNGKLTIMSQSKNYKTVSHPNSISNLKPVSPKPKQELNIDSKLSLISPTTIMDLSELIF